MPELIDRHNDGKAPDRYLGYGGQHIGIGEACLRRRATDQLRQRVCGETTDDQHHQGDDQVG